MLWDAGLGLPKALGPLPNMLCPCIGVGSGSHGRHSAEEAGARTGGSFTSQIVSFIVETASLADPCTEYLIKSLL